MSSGETYSAFDADRRMVRLCRLVTWAAGFACLAAGFGLLGVIWSPTFTGDYDQLFLFVRLMVSLVPLALAILGMTIVTAMWRSRENSDATDSGLSEASRTTEDFEAEDHAASAADAQRCPFCKNVFPINAHHPISADGSVTCPECNGIFEAA